MPALAEKGPGLRELVSLLEDLYRRQSAVEWTPYLADHGRRTVLRDHVRTFLWYASYLPPNARILDWGCAHGPDSCLLRALLGPNADLHSCDLAPPGRYPVFRSYAKSAYTLLTNPFVLPYGDREFDAVIGSGTLEHTAMDYESLKELYRVLRPRGRLVITYLPNRLSITEWYRRNVRRADYHRRLYGRDELATLLRRTGFHPLTPIRHQTYFWEHLLGFLPERSGLVEWTAFALKALIPVHVLSGAIACVAERRNCM